jgi:1,4-dihydroxy-2-naphthoate octaprenyltransferase
MERTFFSLIKLIRYRFLLIAGLFPYGLGTAIAFYSEKRFNLSLFLMGFFITSLALIGVEAFNEYFDWRIGTDRVFQLNPKPVTSVTFFIGMTSFFIAFVVSIILTMRLGMTIIIFYFIGFMAALSYLVPPVKLSHRGLGEIVISLSYGPLLVLASYYIQTRRMAVLPLFASLIPAFLLLQISILNQVPDYVQDRLVGKRNICVRIGKKNVIRLYGVITIFFYGVIISGLISGSFPRLAWLTLACLPGFLKSFISGLQTYDNSQRFIPTIRYMIINYIFILSLLITGYLFEFSL